MEPSYCCVNASHCFMRGRENKNVTVTKCNLNGTILFLVFSEPTLTETLCPVFILLLFFFCWNKVGFCCFPRFFVLFSFLSFPLHEGGKMTFKKGVLRSVLARRWLSVREGVAVRVSIPAPLSSKYLHQTGNEIIQHRAHTHTLYTHCGACARVYSLNVR